MDNYSKIYWLTRLDFVGGIFIFIAVFFGVWLAAYIINKIVCTFDDSTEMVVLKNTTTRVVVIVLFTVFTFIAGLIPTKTEMIMIYAGGKGMDYVQTDTSLAKIPYQTTQIISTYLDNTIKEMTKKEKE